MQAARRRVPPSDYLACASCAGAVTTPRQFDGSVAMFVCLFSFVRSSTGAARWRWWRAVARTLSPQFATTTRLTPVADVNVLRAVPGSHADEPCRCASHEARHPHVFCGACSGEWRGASKKPLADDRHGNHSCLEPLRSEASDSICM